jgi:hypothetical protein
MPHSQGPQFYFTSSLFEIEPGEDEQTNPLCYGKQFSNWMRDRLTDKCYEVEEVIPEDWGWCVVCARKPFMLWVGCVSVHSYNKSRPEDPIPQGKDVVWACSVVAEPPFLANLLRRVNVEPALGQLESDVEAIRRDERDIVLTERP